MAAYNAESTLARMVRPYYSRADDEARALLREAFTLSGDPARPGHRTAPQPCPARPLPAAHRDRDRYPDTDLTISYGVKGQPDTS